MDIETALDYKGLKYYDEKSKEYIEEKVSNLQTQLEGNSNDLTSHTGDTTVHITSAERTDWNDANNKKHTHSNKTILDNTTASYTTAEQTKLSGIETGANKTIIDSALSSTSTNTVQNKVINTALAGKADISHGTHVTYGTTASALGTSSAGTATTVSRSDHIHALPALTSCTGTLTVAKGGTGATDAATARTNLGLGTAATYATTTSITSGGTGLITSGAAYTGLSGKAPTAHSATALTYGGGTASNYGHVKLSDSYTTSGGAASASVAASSKAVADAYAEINSNLIKTVTKNITTDQWGQVNYTTVGVPAGSMIISAVVRETPSMYCVCASNIRVYYAATTADNHIPASNVSVTIQVNYI